MTRLRRLVKATPRWILYFGAINIATGATPDGHLEKESLSLLTELSESVRTLASRVAPSVVQIVVDRYDIRTSSDGRANDDVYSLQTIGSGVIVDASGYIVTNAHVIQDAKRIRVKFGFNSEEDTDGSDESISIALEQRFAPAKEAALVGVFKEGDLALIKVAATGLPVLKFANYATLRQGQVVFAFGSRAGLHNSLSMGVVSSLARQLNVDSPFIYIQTDAAINPGDSGGPLVNTAGEIVGMNTFILSQSGGSEGIGFALPGSLVKLVAENLMQFGYFRRQVIGVSVQTIQPALALALHIPRNSGVIVSDVLPGSPAELAGIRLNDIVIATNGKPVRNVPTLMMTLLTQPVSGSLSIDVLRDGQPRSIQVTPRDAARETDLIADLMLRGHADLPAIGAIGVTVERDNASFSDLRSPGGVYIAAWSNVSGIRVCDLEIGDVIHSVNGAAISTIQELQARLMDLKPGEPVALLIERNQKLQYVAFERE
jgi:serine protease Do